MARHSLVIPSIFGLLLAIGGHAIHAEDEPAGVLLEAIQVQPDAVDVDTLCQLSVTLENRGERHAYAFGFDVELNGQALPLYETQLFLQPIAPGESATVELFNFWTTETGRGAPKDGKLVVEVRFREAAWLEITEEADGDETVEVWTPRGAVPGLPLEKSLTLPFGTTADRAKGD